MRKKLKDIGSEERHCFSGKFVRFGSKNGYKGPLPTVLLTEVKDAEGNYVTDHLWFNLTKGFQKLELKEGDVVSFMARVDSYEKGYKGNRWDVYCPVSIDYKLSYPTKIKLIARGDNDEK